MASAVYRVPGKHSEPEDDGRTEPQVRIDAFASRFAALFGDEARPWLVKTMRELRGAIAKKRAVDVAQMATDAAEHLGKPECGFALGVALAEEAALFSKESEGEPRPVAASVFDEDRGWITPEKEK